LEGTLKIIWFQSPCHEQGHLPPDQVAQSSIQPGPEHCQGGGKVHPIFHVSYSPHLPRPYLTNLPIRIPQGDHIKAFLKSRLTTATALPLSSGIIISRQKAARLVRHDLPLVIPCWLLPIPFLSCMWLGNSFPEDLLHNLPRTDWPVVPQILLLTLLENACHMPFPSYQEPSQITVSFKR